MQYLISAKIIIFFNENQIFAHYSVSTCLESGSIYQMSESVFLESDLCFSVKK